MSIKNILSVVFIALVVIGAASYGYNHSNNVEVADNDKTMVLGDLNAAKTWVFLGGLTEDYNNSEAGIANRITIDAIGKEAGIRFISVMPPRRCEYHNNLLCWPHNNTEEFEGTRNYLLSQVNVEEIDGMIGFSNGGYFLNRLGAYENFGVPFVSIGAGGSSPDGQFVNELYLLVGNADEFNIDNVKAYHSQISPGNANVSIVEFEGGHEIPKQQLVELLNNF